MTDTFDNRLTRVPVYVSAPEDQPGPEPEVAPSWYTRAGNALLGVLDQLGVAGLPEGPRREATKEARNKLLHIGPMEEQDYLWPEKMLRSAVTLAGDVRTGNVPPPGLRREDYTDIPADPSKVGGTPYDDLIQRVQDMAGLAMAGGIGGTGQGGVALGSGPVRGASLPKSEKPAPIWYSPVEHALEQSTQGSATGAQWLATIRNSRGVKPEELDWTGLRQFLEERADKPVTRPELHEYLRDNRVELQDVTKGGHKDWTQEDSARLNDLEWRRNDLTDAEEAEFQRLVDRENNASEPGSSPEITKYSSYQLPGGENYREHLITMPSKEVRSPRGAEESERLSAMANYRSSHWDEPNIVAHVRSNVREMPGSEGKPLRSLHLEEVQSDWHQAGRRKGYQQPVKNPRPEFDQVQKELNAIDAQHPYNGDVPFNEYMRSLPPELAARYRELASRQAELQEAVNRFGRNAPDMRVPDAPWKKTWHELALRRMVRLAAEEGMDRISWTPGEAQAARYDLSKQIDTIELRRSSKDAERGLLIAKGKQGQSVFDKKVDLKELPDLIGKEAADKLLKQEYNQTHASGTGHQKLENADLKVGGEGMRGFYDKMMVQAAEKLGREFGVKVIKGKIGPDASYELKPPADGKRQWTIERDGNVVDGYASKAEAEEALKQLGPTGHEVWYFDVPPAMREAALGRGMPLFSGGKMFVPSGAQRSEESER